MIEEILQPVEAVLRAGGFAPIGDHFILFRDLTQMWRLCQRIQ